MRIDVELDGDGRATTDTALEIVWDSQSSQLSICAQSHSRDFATWYQLADNVAIRKSKDNILEEIRYTNLDLDLESF